MYYGITDLATFVIGTIFIVLLPGPNSIYVMTIASRWGIAAGYRSACGIFVGDLILMTLSATGAASLFLTNPSLFKALKYAGALYLCWLGIGLVRSALASPRDTLAAGTEAPTIGAAKPFTGALLISLLNPKAILFFVSFFIQFVSPDYAHPEVSFLILGAIVQFFSAIYLVALIYSGSYLADLSRRRKRLASTATCGVGALFIAFGVKLANEGLA